MAFQPHRVRQFKLSNDPQFAAKLHDIVGLYVDPPDHAIVLSVDEKSQIQALDRTQPGLPMKKGRAGTMTHDCKRHGVTTLFAALDVLEGKVIGQCMKRHRHQEFIRFLNLIEARVSKKKTIHVIVDNYATHKHPEVMGWLEKHRRFVFHFTPTSASWLNAIEGFFAKLTKKRLKRGVFRSLPDLKDAIHRFLDHTNANPKPFIWTNDPNKIIAAVKRGPSVRFNPLENPRRLGLDLFTYQRMEPFAGGKIDLDTEALLKQSLGRHQIQGIESPARVIADKISTSLLALALLRAVEPNK